MEYLPDLKVNFDWKFYLDQYLDLHIAGLKIVAMMDLNQSINECFLDHPTDY
jgi:hypothetical protein